ncbi:thiopeptide-type bacteriocin biosynthesis protein [Amycolatopsis benzoatilytica]|uniref:thiopeptide-type bacteriocin biosynthesis protein n=1 Tax=Amycolatopsis benzoatilytica TaxID=346045 RepID=UPI00037D67DF|nr:thiopeptide-type bacteriocin biosynthesis protein [Amycolatopsis benzoatilytica]
MAEPREWLYYRVPVEPDGAGEPVLHTVVTPIVRQLRAEVPELRWFYLRFLDATGLHLRWRLSAAPAELDHVEQVVDDALAGRYRKHLYEPEKAKFGDLAVAEQLFQLSSETALELLARHRQGGRSGLAAAVMLALTAGLPASQRRVFLHQYGWYWSGGPARRRWTAAPWTSLADPRVRAKASGLLAEANAILAGPSGELIRDFSRQFWATANTMPLRSGYFQLFHHLHLTGNRLGVFPAAEAVIARLLYLTTADQRIRDLTLVT